MKFLSNNLDVENISKKIYKIFSSNVGSFLLFLYFTSLIVVQVVGMTAYFFSLFVAFVFVIYVLFNNRSEFLDVVNIYFYIFIILTVLFSRSFNLYDNLAYLLGIIINMLTYEIIDDVRIKKSHIILYICTLIFGSVLYSVLTHSYDTIFFRNRNSVPILLLFILMLMEIYSYKIKIFYLFVWIFVIFFAILSSSRAGFLALVSYFILRFIKTKKRQIAVFIVFLCIIFYVYLFSNMGILLEPYGFKLFGRNIFYLARRDILWKYALELIYNYPLGLGYKGYSEIFNLELGVGYSVHNTYLNILLQFGIPFSFVYFIFLMRLINKCKNTRLLAVLYAVYLRAMFESGVPFGFSLNSSMLLLPLFVGKTIENSGKRV